MSIATRESNHELVTIKTDENTLATIEGIVSECSLEALGDANQFYRTMKLAAGISALRKAITNEMMSEIMSLQGTSLGFRTDADTKGGYDVKTVKDCTIETVLRGGRMVGNEMNIISGSAYFTKAFYTRKLREYPGLTDLKICLGVPVMKSGGALVPGTASWKLDGKPGRLEKLEVSPTEDNRIPVKVNSGSGADQILGKAERKIKKAIYDLITGSETSDGEITDAPNGGTITPRGTTLDAVAERLENKSASKSVAADKPLAAGELPADLSLFQDRCDAAATIGEVTKADEALRGPNGRTLEDHETVLADKWRDEALKRIRESRGERSNKDQQKTLTD